MRSTSPTPGARFDATPRVSSALALLPAPTILSVTGLIGLGLGLLPQGSQPRVM